jgi:hypothetical protein
MKTLSLPLLPARVKRPVAYISIQVAVLIIISGMAVGQLVIPVDRNAPPPKGLDFRGSWVCKGGSDTAMLRVGSQHRHGWHDSWRDPLPSIRWTRIVEKDSDFTGRYFVGYDRDKHRFVMIDADDPAYAPYVTDGWQDGKLTLTLLETDNQLPTKSRWVFDVSGERQFTVTVQDQENDVWVAERSSTCRKQDSKHRR